MRSIHIVVARYKESLDWLKNLALPSNAKVFLYNKGPKDYEFHADWTVISKENFGQCWGSYITHMIDQYGNFADCTLFTTGCCMQEQKQFLFQKVYKDVIQLEKNYSLQFTDKNQYDQFVLNEWKSQTAENAGGTYTVSPTRPLGKWFQKHFPGKTLSDTQSYLSIFALTKEQLSRVPKETYVTIEKDLTRSALQEEAHYLERLIPSIWGTPEKPLTLHVINLARRKDRWNLLLEHTKQFSGELIIKRREGSDASLYPNLYNLGLREKGGLHCCISHKELLHDLLHDSLHTDIHLIGEDDLVIKDFSYIKTCIQKFQESRFDICNLGYNPLWMPVFKPASEGLKEVESGQCLCTHLYAIKTNAIPKFISAIEYTASQLLSGKTVFTHSLDNCWTFPEFKLKMCVPSRVETVEDMPAIQNNSKSDINL